MQILCYFSDERRGNVPFKPMIAGRVASKVSGVDVERVRSVEKFTSSPLDREHKISELTSSPQEFLPSTTL